MDQFESKKSIGLQVGESSEIDLKKVKETTKSTEEEEVIRTFVPKKIVTPLKFQEKIKAIY